VGSSATITVYTYSQWVERGKNKNERKKDKSTCVVGFGLCVYLIIEVSCYCVGRPNPTLYKITTKR